MFSLFKQRKKEQNKENTDLLSKLSEMAYTTNINQLLYSPEGKLYILNMYTSNIDELGRLIYSSISTVDKITAVNIHSYFNNSSVDVSAVLNKLLPHFYKNSINVKVTHDLYELYEGFKFIQQLKE